MILNNINVNKFHISKNSQIIFLIKIFQFYWNLIFWMIWINFYLLTDYQKSFFIWNIYQIVFYENHLKNSEKHKKHICWKDCN